MTYQQSSLFPLSQRDPKSPLSVEAILTQYSITSSFSPLNFGKTLLRQSAHLIERSLEVNQQYQPFDLAPEIQELLHSLEKIPHYFSSMRRFFYHLPIIGFYFSPLRRIDKIGQQILQEITVFNNLLKTQITLLQYKISAITPLLHQNSHLLIETFNYQKAGEEIAATLKSSEPVLYKKLPSLISQLEILDINRLSLTQHALQLEQSLQSLQQTYLEMNFIHQQLFPIWTQQLRLIHQIVIQREPIKIIQSKKEETPTPIQSSKLSQKAEVLTQINSETTHNYQKDLFDMTHVTNIQHEITNALKSLLSQ